MAIALFVATLNADGQTGVPRFNDCGTECVQGAIIDARTGRVFMLPFSLCCWGTDVGVKIGSSRWNFASTAALLSLPEPETRRKATMPLASMDFKTTASCSSNQFSTNAQFPCTRACPVLQCAHQPEQSVSRSVSPQRSFSKVI
jgi:hypothetical protein